MKTLFTTITASLALGALSLLHGDPKGNLAKLTEALLHPGEQEPEAKVPAVALIPSTQEIDDRLKTLSSRKRSMDPFGLTMFPTEKSAKETVQSKQDRTSNQITLNQAVHSLKIGLVNPTEKEFVVHGNNIYQGDTITLAYKGESFAAQVTEVTPFRIAFTDVRTHSVAWVKLSMIPAVRATLDGSQHSSVAEQKFLLPMEPFNRTR